MDSQNVHIIRFRTHNGRHNMTAHIATAINRKKKFSDFVKRKCRVNANGVLTQQCVNVVAYQNFGFFFSRDILLLFTSTSTRSSSARYYLRVYAIKELFMAWNAQIVCLLFVENSKNMSKISVSVNNVYFQRIVVVRYVFFVRCRKCCIFVYCVHCVFFSFFSFILEAVTNIYKLHPDTTRIPIILIVQSVFFLISYNLIAYLFIFL